MYCTAETRVAFRGTLEAYAGYIITLFTAKNAGEAELVSSVGKSHDLMWMAFFCNEYDRNDDTITSGIRDGGNQKRRKLLSEYLLF